MVIGSAGPKLAPPALVLVVDEEQGVVLAAGDLANDHVVEDVLELGWLNDSVLVLVAKTKLSLVGVAAAEDLVLICDEDRVTTASLKILDLFAVKGFLRNSLGLPDVLHCASMLALNQT